MALQRITHSGIAPPTSLTSSISATDTTFQVSSGTGYPTGAAGPFVLDIDAGTSSEEKILCSSLSGTTVTVAAGGRGWDGTTATAHAVNPNGVTHVCSSAELDDANAHIYVTTRNDHTQYPVVSGAPSINQGLVWNGTAWVPTSLTTPVVNLTSTKIGLGANVNVPVTTNTQITQLTGLAAGTWLVLAQIKIAVGTGTMDFTAWLSTDTSTGNAFASGEIYSVTANVIITLPIMTIFVPGATWNCVLMCYASQACTVRNNTDSYGLANATSLQAVRIA
jgi:hypothetical protein